MYFEMEGQGDKSPLAWASLLKRFLNFHTCGTKSQRGHPTGRADGGTLLNYPIAVRKLEGQEKNPHLTLTGHFYGPVVLELLCDIFLFCYFHCKILALEHMDEVINACAWREDQKERNYSTGKQKRL